MDDEQLKKRTIKSAVQMQERHDPNKKGYLKLTFQKGEPVLISFYKDDITISGVMDTDMEQFEPVTAE